MPFSNIGIGTGGGGGGATLLIDIVPHFVSTNRRTNNHIFVV